MIHIVLDVETSGLPTGIKYGRFPHYTQLSNYDSARIVSISWIVCKCDTVLQQSYYVVKPKDFIISDESIAIHGITNEYAKENGLDFERVMEELRPWVECTNGIVAHNINFDSNVILSELYRHKMIDFVDAFKGRNFICTMKKGKEFMNYHKNPKLSELHEFLYNEPIENAHNAQADTYYCYRCFIKMFPFEKGVFFFKNNEIALTDEQKRVVFEDLDKNIMVIACAGSGKCHARNTEILMYDGSLKYVQDIRVGDQVMGDDSTPRNVLSLGRGRDMMYDISPSKYDRFTVNSEHILCLKYEGNGIVIGSKSYVVTVLDSSLRLVRKHFQTIQEAKRYYNEICDNQSNYFEISVNRFLELPEHVRKNLKLYSRPVDFFDSNPDPYSTLSPEPFAYGASLSANDDGIDNKYKLNTRYVRQRVLEGLASKYDISLDGQVFYFKFNDAIKMSFIKDILFLARSIGYVAKFNVSQKHIMIYKINIENTVCFKVIEKGEGDYYGFTLDGNHKYYMGNFIITHNTTTTLCRIKHLIENGVEESNIMLTTFTRDAATDMKDKLIDIMGYKPKLTVGTIDGISKCFTTRCLGTYDDLKHVGEHGHEFLKLIREQPGLISHYKYLFVDEFQDINDFQFEVINEFYKNGCLIFGVGDDAQNIYTFRGSNIKYILKFDKYFSNSAVYKLTYNFRSSPSIVKFANASIENNINQIPKKMVSANPIFEGRQNPKPEIFYYPNAKSQNNKILESIKLLMDEKIPLHEIVVLCPINQPLYQVEELLTQNGIKNIFLDGKADVRTSRKSGHVCLSTIHKSKGLEWDIVFMISMCDDIIPKIKNARAIEEERRLFYVGCTRAKKRLFIMFTKGSQSSYVTRYVSEIPPIHYTFQNYSPSLIGKSDADGITIKKSVMKLVSLLDGHDFIKLKEMGILPIIPNENIDKTKIYEGYTYKGVVKNEDLFADFGIFVDALLTREASIRFGLDESMRDKYAIQTLAHIALDQKEYDIYRIYRGNIEDNIGAVEKYRPRGKDELKSILEVNSKTISWNHMGIIESIVFKIKENAAKYEVGYDKIPIFNERFLPLDFEDRMEGALSQYSDKTIDYKKCIDDIWEVSKCQMIVTERRRRLLFKTVTGSDILKDYNELFENLSKFLNFIDDKAGYEPNPRASIYCRRDLKLEEGIFGEADMIVGDTVIDYKVAAADELDAMWIIQLLCYKTLCDINKIPIKNIGIFNALRGWYYQIDVSDWKGHYKLMSYLLDKREKTIAANMCV